MNPETFEKGLRALGGVVLDRNSGKREKTDVEKAKEILGIHNRRDMRRQGFYGVTRGYRGHMAPSLKTRGR